MSFDDSHWLSALRPGVWRFDNVFICPIRFAGRILDKKLFLGGGIIKLSAVLADTNKPERMGEYEEKDSRRDAGGGCNRDAAFRLRKEK